MDKNNDIIVSNGTMNRTPNKNTSMVNGPRSSQPAPGSDRKAIYEHDENLDEWNNWNPMEEDFNSVKNTLAINPVKDPLAQITGQVLPVNSRVGNVEICDHYAKFGNCADGKYCEKRHIAPEERERIWTLQNHYESNKNRICMIYTYLSPQDYEPNPDVLLLVSVTSVKSPVNFHFVAPYENMNFAHHAEQDFNFYIDRVQQASSIKTKLERCHEQMASLFDHSYRIDNLNDEIYLSQIVACKLKDGRYRRAMVVDLPNDARDKFNYKLLLIDVGIEVELPRELIYDIKADCLSDPPMAVNCSLNVKPPDGLLKWPRETLVEFNNMARGEKFLMCKMTHYVDYDRIYLVDLYHLKTRKSLTDLLIEKNLASRC